VIHCACKPAVRNRVDNRSFRIIEFVRIKPQSGLHTDPVAVPNGRQTAGSYKLDFGSGATPKQRLRTYLQWALLQAHVKLEYQFLEFRLGHSARLNWIVAQLDSKALSNFEQTIEPGEELEEKANVLELTTRNCTRQYSTWQVFSDDIYYPKR
jgi:hypothetical protein